MENLKSPYTALVSNELEIQKQIYIEELNQRVEDKILEKTNADFLTKLITKAEDFDEVHNIMRMGIMYKKTGFIFSARNENDSSNIKYLKKNTELSFETDENNLTHKLIIGDNYDALKQLLINHRNKIDVIYIDPPYGCNDMGEFAKTNYSNEISRDNLLSMLYIRLQLAKQLLTEDGVIFCSIDDKNMAYVKCLFDEIFGEVNFIQCYTWECNFKPDNTSQLIRPNAEYVLCYANKRNIETHFNKFSSKTSGMASLSKSKETVKELTFPANSVFTTLPDGHYAKGQYDEKSWELLEDVDVLDGKITTELKVRGHSFWSTEEKIKNELANGTQIWIKSKKFIPYNKKTTGGMVVPTTILPRKFIEDYDASKKELESIVGDMKFDNPKPTSLIKFLISMIDAPNAVVLDFFAGSGTTGQAVLELNKEDGGNRQFILCTNNEINNTNPNGIAYDVTTKRLKRTMTGECYDGTNNFKWLEKNEPYGDNLEVTEIKEISPTLSSINNTPFDVINETLYDILPFENKEDKINWICTHFQNTMKKIETDESYINRWGE